MENCSRCDELPDDVPQTGTLYVHAGLEHTSSKIRTVFEDAGLPCEMDEDRMIQVSYQLQNLSAALEKVQDELSDSECTDTRVIPVAEGQEPSPGDLIGARSLDELIGQIRGKWLIDMMRDDRLFTVFQPIVQASNPGEVFGYECLLRGRNASGDTVNPGRIFQTASSADLVFQLDRRARVLSVENSQSHEIPSDRKMFINFLPTSIYDPEFCLNTTMEAIEKVDARPEQFVFEVVESEEVNDRDKLIDIISYYRDEGLQVALDDFGAGYSSLQMLSDIRPDYLKLDMGLVQNVPDNSMNTELCRQIMSVSSDHDITTLAEGIEERKQLSWFQDHGLDLAQGYLFAEPDVPPPDVSEQF